MFPSQLRSQLVNIFQPSPPKLTNMDGIIPSLRRALDKARCTSSSISSFKSAGHQTGCLKAFAPVFFQYSSPSCAQYPVNFFLMVKVVTRAAWTCAH